MSAILRHPLRVLGRSLWLGWQFTVAAADYLLTTAFRSPQGKRHLQGQWLQRNSRRVLRVFAVDWRSSGPVPQCGLLVTNHLSYADILVIAAITPAAFVSKSEIRNWPVFGYFARMAGTVFVERDRRTDVPRAGAEIKQALDAGTLLVLFAEGVSSDGQTVLPFKSALLEPVIGQDGPVTAGLISYAIADGDLREDVYYWGDMTLVPHLLNLMTKSKFSVRVSFTPVLNPANNRKDLARQLHAEVLRMKAADASMDGKIQGKFTKTVAADTCPAIASERRRMRRRILGKRHIWVRLVTSTATGFFKPPWRTDNAVARRCEHLRPRCYFPFSLVLGNWRLELSVIRHIYVTNRLEQSAPAASNSAQNRDSRHDRSTALH